MSFNKLKYEMKLLIDLSAKIATLNQIALHHSDMKDKRNYNPERLEKIRVKVSELQEEYSFIYEKWFR